MTNEAIEKIREAEKNASELIADAKKKASEIRAGAESGVADTEKALGEMCANSVREMTENAKKKSNRIIDDGVSAARIDAKRLVSEATKNCDAAADEIVRGIMEKWQ